MLIYKHIMLLWTDKKLLMFHEKQIGISDIQVMLLLVNYTCVLDDLSSFISRQRLYIYIILIYRTLQPALPPSLSRSQSAS